MCKSNNGAVRKPENSVLTQSAIGEINLATELPGTFGNARRGPM